MKQISKNSTALWLFYIYTLRRSIGLIAALLFIPSLAAVGLSYSLLLLKDPVVAPIPKPLNYSVPDYLEEFDIYVEVSPVSDQMRRFCEVIHDNLQLPCFEVNEFQKPLYNSDAFNHLADELQIDFGPQFRKSEFLEYSAEYKKFHGYEDMCANGKRNPPLFQIRFDAEDTEIKYKVMVNDEIITRSHREKAMENEIEISDFTSSMYFSTIGTFLENEIESFLVQEQLEQHGESGKQLKYEIAELPISSIGKEKEWEISYFAVFCPEAFSSVLLGIFLFKFRYFWLLKRMKIGDITFWGWILITGTVLLHISESVFILTCRLCNILPFAAYQFGTASVVAFVESCAISAFICFLIVCFENQQIFTIIATVIALAFSIFPVLLSIFLSSPKSIWDDSFAPQIISYVFTLISPIFMQYGFTELLLFTIDIRSLESYDKYDGPYFGIEYLFTTLWDQHDFERIMYAGTYNMPGVWYYFGGLLGEAAVFFGLTVYLSYCKEESKQCGLPFGFLFNKSFWKSEETTSTAVDYFNVSNLKKSYRKEQIIRNFNIKLENNTICGIIGATGSGKTTVLNMLAGYTNFTKSSDTKYDLLGKDLTDPYTRLRMLDQISICPQDKLNMFDELSIQENINILKDYSEISDDLVKEFLELLNLSHAVNKTFKQLSGGMERRFALLVSLLVKPTILLLDEMTSNVDPLLKRNIWDAIGRYFQLEKCCIILTSHDSNDISNIADEVAFLDHGTIIEQGEISKFIEEIPGMKLVLNKNKNVALELLRKASWNHTVNWDEKECEVFVEVTTNSEFAQLIELLNTKLDKADYNLVSYPINEVFYKSYENKIELDDKETLSITEPIENFVSEKTDLLGNQGVSEKPQNSKAMPYFSNVFKSKYYEALQSKFFVLLASVATALFFVALEKFILESVETNPDRISKEYNSAVQAQSFDMFKRMCVQETGPIEKEIFECLTTHRDALFGENNAEIGPQLRYASSPQRYLDVIGFDCIEDYHFVFGYNSLQLSDYGDNLHAYIIGDVDETPASQVITASDNYTLGRDGYEMVLSKKTINDIGRVSEGFQRFLDRRFVQTGVGLKSNANFVVQRNLQEIANQYVAEENHNKHNISIQNLSHDELLNYEFNSPGAIIDPKNSVLYLQIPYFSIDKIYENVPTFFDDSTIGTFSYFRHPSPVFGGPWLVDMDPTYPINYANDILTKTYTAELRTRLSNQYSGEDLFNKVYIHGEFVSEPKYQHNETYSPEYAQRNLNAYYSFMYFIPWIQCLLSIIALEHIHTYVDQFTLAFINGVSISIFKYIFSKVLLEIAVYSIKIYALYLITWILQPADCFFKMEMWVYPILYSISIVCFLFFLDLVVSNYSISCLYLGAVTIIVVLVNPIMQPSLILALFGSLFIPGFFYVVAARMSALYEEFNKWWLLLGITIQFVELFAIVLAKYLTTVRNSMAIKRDNKTENILTAEGINAYYSRHSPILTDFNLAIPHGTTLCLAGANGCGKSTFTKCLTGYQVHCEGRISVNERIGIVPEDDCFDRNLTVIQNLKKFTCFSNVSPDVLCEQVGLGQYRNERAKALSAGYARVLTISLVLATNPQLLILDEVTVGLDFAMKKMVWEAILAQDCSVLIITHDMLEIEALCDIVCVMQNGKILSNKSLAETLLKAETGYILTVYNEAASGEKEFIIEEFAEGQGVEEVSNWIEKHDVQYGSWNIEKMSMENVFLHIIGQK